MRDTPIVLAGADVVLPDRVLPHASIVIERDRIASIESRMIDGPSDAQRYDVHGCVVVPGFIDVHVHGVEGHDVLDGPDAVREVAARLPRYGVTAFCPTSIACTPAVLTQMLDAIAASNASESIGARVLPAHLESNFINPEYKGAQPPACLRTPGGRPQGDFTGRQIVDAIEAHREQVAIVTLAPEIDGGLELVRQLAVAGHVVSIGHTGATYEVARHAIDAGVTHATHLFNRMTPLSHRAPGVPGAVLEAESVRAELICDGFHVHPALLRLAIRSKGPDGIVAITDGTAGSGLPVGSRTRLGGRSIVVTDRTAELDDGTLAGSVLTMNRAFEMLVKAGGVSMVEAAQMCASSPARQLRLSDAGTIEIGKRADLAVLDGAFAVRHTFLAGREWRNTVPAGNV